MKLYIKLIFIALFTVLTTNIFAQTDSTATFEVSGNCGMCKSRIEKAAKLTGVESAIWNIEDHKITVKYNFSKVKLASIQQAIAQAGHDTPLFQAPDEVYNKLHECCEYERMGENHTTHEHDGDDDHDHDHDAHAKENGTDNHEEDHNHEHIITGVVVNEDNKASLTPISNVNVKWLEGPKAQVTSNENGVFKIKHDKGNKHLVFSYAGMQPDTIEVKNLHEVLVVHAQNNVLSEVVVSRRKKSSYINALSANRAEILTAQELFKAACCDLSESFETTVSVDVVSNDAVTGSKQIQLLGLSGIYTQLTVENLPGPRGFATPLGLNSIAGTWIESIDISKGIGSVVNGYENMAGQINVELKKPHNSERLFFNAYANNMGRTDVNLNLAQKINDHWSVGLLLHDNFMYNKNMNFSDNGFRDIPVGNLFSGINRWHYENGKGTIAQFGIKYLKDDRTGGQVNFDKSRDKGKTDIYGLGFDNERIEGFAKIGYVFPQNRLRSIGLQLSASNYKQDSYFGLRNYNSEQTNGYANLIFQDIIGSVTHKYKVGASMTYDKYKEDIESNNFDRIETVSGLFAEYTFSPSENFDMVLGLREDYNSLYGWFTTPRLVARYNPFTGNTIRFSTGRGQRTANIFAENMSILASSRTLDYAALKNNQDAYGLRPEVSWNTGITIDQNFQLFGRESGVSVELFHNNFQNQVVIDWENPRTVSIYNLDGKSYSNSLQAEFRFMPAPHFEARMAYRLLDVQTDYKDGKLQKPLTAKHRGFVNLAYNLHSGWSFDYTFNTVGPKRLPSTSANPSAYQLANYSNAYITMNAQISKSFGADKNFTIYVGGENLTNKFQKDPILAFDQPFGQYFDTNLLWGPITGRMFYTGIRYHIK
ncbi:carboxypeptidase-like regulatory domain-containing protein [Sphingobacterium litopenaei]|uniref:Carboxypeptidase-like regulatory domain-containing protein n=1 Tax=Sphingobacterium litopenaei TaxID=2763500 RepID=A0ABR7YIR3_9SPHI|nr:carboxypeptidase-like regulatory domain-containing protein [Sphingobacterium litopenaei]MBD1431166.1 carboxypeptidase-like regulatory domain-containing protein [Sphingobacterium litopenaei]